MLSACDIGNPIYNPSRVKTYRARTVEATIYINGNGSDNVKIQVKYTWSPEPEKCATVYVEPFTIIPGADDMKEDIYHTISEDLGLLITEINWPQ